MNDTRKAVKAPTQRCRDEFAGALRGLVHGLSQPLTSLQGSLEVALMGELDETECRKVLQQSLEEIHRIAEVLEKFRRVLEAESRVGG